MGEDEGSSKTLTFFTLLKAMIGIGIIFLPRGFSLGGYGFSIFALVFMAVISAVCMYWLSKAQD